MSTPVLSGIPFLINTSDGGQFDPAVTALSGGRFAVVWREVTATALFSIKMQIVNADGTLNGPERLVGTQTALTRLDPDITTLVDGSFVVSFTFSTPGSIYSGPEGDGNNSAVMAQRFDSNGNALGNAFVVNSQTLQSQKNGGITALDDGGYAVVFETGGPVGGNLEEMGLRTFDADGTPRGLEVNYPWAGLTAQRNPVVTQLTNGNLVMAWEAADPSAPGIHDTNVFGITARILTAAGVPVTARFGVNTTTSNQQLEPDITALAGGGFVVTWTDRSGQSADTSFDAVRAQVFDSAGVKVGAERLVNTTTLNGQSDSEVAALSDGRFMVAWTDGSTFPSADIRVRLFNADGSPSGSELVVNTQAPSSVAPSLVELSDGRVMVTWRDSGGTAGGDIAGQIIDPREAAVTFAGTAAVDIVVGTRFGDVLNGLDQNDRLFGAAGADTIRGGDGHDRIDGGLGNDTMTGGAGNDTYVVNALGDRVFETTTAASSINAGGIDTVQSALNFSLNAYAGVRFVERLTLTGTVNASGTGNALANILTGNAGNNLLNGGLGNDTMIGGAGRDTFVFNTAISAANIDRITDFAVIDDAIRLDNAFFAGLAAGGLAVSAFAANASGAATDRLDRIIYETDTGRLSFDADGSGGGARVHFATLDANLALTNGDFLVF